MNDPEIAQKYINKINNCKSSKTTFSLTFYEFKRLITAKRCKYTGVLLTNNHGGNVQPTNVTIDRIDSNIGYVMGNVVACCHGYNQFKGIIENPNNIIDFKTLESALKIQKKLQGGF